MHLIVRFTKLLISNTKVQQEIPVGTTSQLSSLARMKFGKATLTMFLCISTIAGSIFFSPIANAQTPCPSLWQGLIAEDTTGNYQTYLAIASVVRNRLNAGLDHGLVALKRKNLDSFVNTNSRYMLNAKGIDIIDLSNKAIEEIFTNNRDFANGATHYEHTGVYTMPKWAKNMKLVKVMYPNTKQEIKFWRVK
jgi:hypothetical protein